MPSRNVTISALRALSRKPEFQGNEWSEHVEDYRSGEDRTVAVIGGASTESALRARILEKMVPLNNTQFNELFLGNGPLSTFSSKIKVAFALGIIDHEIARNAEIIKEIRNAFSHTQHHIEFTTAAVSDACHLLHYHERESQLSTELSRHQFLSAVIDTGYAIWGSKPLPHRNQQDEPLQQRQPTQSPDMNRRGREQPPRRRQRQSSPE
jgi:hypothetical protein